jgi:hypothetical protein
MKSYSQCDLIGGVMMLVAKPRLSWSDSLPESAHRFSAPNES